MSALGGPLHLIALVLVISGAQKIVDPAPSARAMADAGLPVPRRGRRETGIVLGVVEALTGLATFALPHPATAVWLGAFYLALAAFVVRLRRHDATAACGCFGAASAPPTTAHVVVNALSAALALAAAALGVPDLAELLDDGVSAVVPYAILVVTGAALVLLAPGALAQIDDTLHDPAPSEFRVRPSLPRRAGARR